MLKIGDFAKIGFVTIRALRHYDAVGLLKPAGIDEWTGYRYYKLEQLATLNRILALKDLGLALEEIAIVLDEPLSAEQIRGMLRLKRAELQQQAFEVSERLARVEARLMQIDMEGKMPDYEVVLKKVDAQNAAIARGVVANMDEMGRTFDGLFDEVLQYIAENRLSHAGPAVALFYTMNETMEDIQVGAAIPVTGSAASTDRVGIEVVPPAPIVASTVHKGPFATLSLAYQALFQWIEKNGYRLSGPNRELYLQYERGGDQNNYITELQLEVERV